MKEYITLEQAKRHLEVDLDYTGDDTLITGIIKDVLEIVESDLCVELLEIETSKGELPGAIRRAALLLIGTYYKSREDEIPNNESAKLTSGYQRLVSNYRNYER